MKFILLLVSALCQATMVNEAFIDKVGFIESRLGLDTRLGDKGRAVGVYQFWEISWRHTSEIRKSKNQATYPYSCAKNPVIARLYARSYLEYIEKELNKFYKRQATTKEIYAAWNVGITKFKKLKGRLDLIPKTTKIAISKL